MMDKVKAERPSEEEMWAGASGDRWLANAMQFEEMLRPIGDALIARAGFLPGERVIDVGCGAGGMSLAIGKRVGSGGGGGSVVGLDISPGLVAEGTRRAAAAGVKNVRFVLGDAAKVTGMDGWADCLVSRFGVMFFTEPYGAFGHLHGLIRAGGRTTFACWAGHGENPWMMEAREVMATHFELPTVPPRTPGPFAFEEQAYLKGILEKAGFGAIGIEHWKTELYVGGPGLDAAGATAFLMKALSLVQRAMDAPPAVRAAVEAEIAAKLSRYKTPGGVRMPAAVWLVSAEA